MTLKNFLNYCKYSGVWINLTLNPYHWRLSFDYTKPDDMDPSLYSIHISIAPLSIKFVLDDGSW
jgi:hypothetical protein